MERECELDELVGDQGNSIATFEGTLQEVRDEYSHLIEGLIKRDKSHNKDINTLERWLNRHWVTINEADEWVSDLEVAT